MLPLPRFSSVTGIPLTSYTILKKNLDEIVQQHKTGCCESDKTKRCD